MSALTTNEIDMLIDSAIISINRRSLELAKGILMHVQDGLVEECTQLY